MPSIKTIALGVVVTVIAFAVYDMFVKKLLKIDQYELV